MQHGAHSLIRFSRTARCCRRPLIPPLFVVKRHSSTTNPLATPPSIPPRQWSTPLAKTVADAIEATGPISIAAYMRQCLTSDQGGYYTTTRPNDLASSISDQFGKSGDFITSPEISQIFGELVGVWFLTEWMGQGRPDKGVQFIEVGPGRGTLMSDVLRTVGQFRSFASAVEGVWLVEAGEGLRRQQKDLLCGTDIEMKEIKEQSGTSMWWEAKSKYSNIPVRWVEDVALLPTMEDVSATGKMPFIVAHEFFDALPIHAFESVAPRPEEEQGATTVLDSRGNPLVRPRLTSKIPQWRELLVSPTKRKFTLPSPSVTDSTSISTTKQPDPDFQLTLAKASTPSSLVLPERPRYQKLKTQISSRVEISPESSRYIQDFARRIGGTAPSSLLLANPGPKSQPNLTISTRKSAGAALIIDYGPLDTIPVNSLRGIRKHEIISPFIHAGEADISADVDFGALADSALEASEGIEVHGPVEQGSWLLQLGIQERAERLIKSLTSSHNTAANPVSTQSTKTKHSPSPSSENNLATNPSEIEDKRKTLESGWRRLVEGGPKGMGKAYKVMAIVPENGGKRPPVGFGGGVGAV